MLFFPLQGLGPVRVLAQHLYSGALEDPKAQGAKGVVFDRYLCTEHASIPQYISYGTNTAIMDDKDECALNEWKNRMVSLQDVQAILMNALII